MKPTGSTPTQTYPSHEAVSVGIVQSSADDGTVLVEEHDQHANTAPHLKPKRVDESQSCVEQFGVTREEYHVDIACGHRSSDGRPIVKIGGVGKFSTADVLDYEAGKAYVRKRDRAPCAHPPAVLRTYRRGPDMDALPYVQSRVGPFA